MKKIFSFAAAMIAAMSMSAQDPIAVTCADAAAAMPAQSGSETEEVYIVTGYITNANGNISKGQQTFYMDDAKGSKKTLQGYWCNLPAEEVEANRPLNVGDKITLTGKIMNYNNTAEIKNGDVAILERAANYIDTIDISVCKAIEIGSALNDLDYSADAYRVYGRLKGQDQVNSSYGLHNFNMACGEQIFKAYNCKGVEGLELGKGDSVIVIGKLYNYRGTIEISNGTVELIEENPEETFDTISVARALEIGEALADGGVTPVKYVIGGYVSSIESYFDPTYKNETFWIADEKGSKAASNADGAFYVFRGTPTPAEEIGLNAKVFVTCKIKKYVKEGKAPVIENEKANDAVNVVEKGEEEVVEAITVAQALEIGLALADQGVSDHRYEITGFVSSIDSYFDATYKNETFWITDSLGSRASGTANGAFEIYRGKPNTEKEIGLDAKIKIVCKIKNYKGTIENDGTGIVFEVLEQGQDLVFDTITVARAIEIGMALEDNATTDVDYVVNGYVVKAYEPDSGYTNQNFYMADVLDEYGEFYVYRCTPDRKVEAGDFLSVFGKIRKYVRNEMVRIEVWYGTATHEERPPLVNCYIYPESSGQVDIVYSGKNHSNATLTAIPNYEYHFVQWSDGITDNPRSIELTHDIEITAIFAKNKYSISVTCDNTQGSVDGANGQFDYLTELTYTAVPKYGYHFVRWSDYNTQNPRTIILEQDTELSAIFAPNTYSISDGCDTHRGYIDGVGSFDYLSQRKITAIPNRGFYFSMWSDGITDNPRTIELIKDTTMTAIFEYLLGGKCGKDGVLTWTLDEKTLMLSITGNGALTDIFPYTYDIVSVSIGNEVSVIGSYAFSGCYYLNSVIIGSSVRVIETDAFSSCSSIKAITCYSQRPPSANSEAFSYLDYSTIIYVPADYLNNYVMHDFWGMYDVRPLGASSTQTDEVQVNPDATTATVVWPSVSGAATYELVIKDKDGNVVCTLIFNAQGQLTSIAFAPSRNNASQQTQTAGFSFTVTGLEEGTGYDLTITSKNESGVILDEKTVSFYTNGGNAIEDVYTETIPSIKTIRDGQIFILRGDKTYTLQGQEVR